MDKDGVVVAFICSYFITFSLSLLLLLVLLHCCVINNTGEPYGMHRPACWSLTNSISVDSTPWAHPLPNQNLLCILFTFCLRPQKCQPCNEPDFWMRAQTIVKYPEWTSLSFLQDIGAASLLIILLKSTEPCMWLPKTDLIEEEACVTEKS